MRTGKIVFVLLILAGGLTWYVVRLSTCSSADIMGIDNNLFTRSSLKDVFGKNDLGSIAVADINMDGHADIIAGGSWYEGPNWDRHLIYEIDGNKYIDNTRGDIYDVDDDGYLDVLGASVPVRSEPYRELFWLKNPGPPYAGPWDKYLITTNLKHLEIVRFLDIDGDNEIEMVTVDDGTGRFGGLRIYEFPPTPTHPDQQDWAWKWVDNRTLHGLGIGDLNQDGKLDIASDFRWYEQISPDKWKVHIMPAPALDDNGDGDKRGQLTMYVIIYDVDNDGDNDIVWTRAHNYGIFWMESSGGSDPVFTMHEILPCQLPSTIHGAAFGDIDNDGDIDIFAGKSRYRHNDPGERDPLDVFWIELVRSGGNVSWVKHKLADDLNMGFMPAIADIDNDGDMDLIMGALGHKRGIPSQSDLTIFRNNLLPSLKSEQ